LEETEEEIGHYLSDRAVEVHRLVRRSFGEGLEEDAKEEESLEEDDEREKEREITGVLDRHRDRRSCRYDAMRRRAGKLAIPLRRHRSAEYAPRLAERMPREPMPIIGRDRLALRSPSHFLHASL